MSHSANGANEQARKPLPAAKGMADEQEEETPASLPWHPQHGQTRDSSGTGTAHALL